jgi:hypothetical protein
VIPGFEIDRSALTYSCRSCKRDGFKSTSDFIRHSCVDVVADVRKLGNFESVAIGESVDADEKVISVEAIEWEDTDDEGCSLCTLFLFVMAELDHIPQVSSILKIVSFQYRKAIIRLTVD